ncbi:MAG TPA: class I SAM-dependent methyltransferase [Candidatus Eremiobacteraceae bacterium]
MPDHRLYTDLATWWPLFSAPNEYDEEAAWIIAALENEMGRFPASLLELGSGGGNIASHLAPHGRLTLVDLNQEMLDVSKRLNPDAEHVRGDMRSVRLGKTFDAVLIHDAIMYMTTMQDLDAALATARAHLPDDGVIVVVPDNVAETLEAGEDTGGHDADDGSGRGVRYLQWTHAAVPGASTYEVDFAILTRDADGLVEVAHDKHIEGIFTRPAWYESFARARFKPPHVFVDPWQREVFVTRAAAL